MQWIAPSEKDAANDTLKKRLWGAADRLRANLPAREDPGDGEAHSPEVRVSARQAGEGDLDGAPAGRTPLRRLGWIALSGQLSTLSFQLSAVSYWQRFAKDRVSSNSAFAGDDNGELVTVA